MNQGNTRMSKNKKTQLARRQFLKDGSLTTATIGLGIFNFGAWRTALAQSRQTGKPVLTEQNLNALIPKDRVAFKRFAGEATRDLPGFLRSHFTLSVVQEREIASLTQADRGLIKKAITVAEEEGALLTVSISRTERASFRPSEPSGLARASFTTATLRAVAKKVVIKVTKESKAIPGVPPYRLRIEAEKNGAEMER
jgi:hypothetical protein